jgi:fructose-bisphosphate aldolase / 2-amino-3,7-dideoxy-D-threo-hept-6-ulosonate synthase
LLTIGKQIRMERIKDRKSGNSLIIPLDHGISEGPIKGIVGLADTIQKVSEGSANAVLQQKGVVPHGPPGLRPGHRPHRPHERVHKARA